MQEANRPETDASRPKKHRHMLRKTLITLLLLFVALTLTVQYGLGFIVRKAARTAGPAVIGTSVEIKGAYVRPFFGIIDMSQMVVGPPEGFKANVFEMNNFRITVDPDSVFSDVIIIKEIAIINPVVSYELSGLRSNINAIMDKLGGAKKASEEEKTDKKPGKKVVIEHFIFSGAKIRLASTATGGKGLLMPMPTLELHDIGKKSGGVTGLEAFAQTLGAICGGIIRSVKDGAVALGGAAASAALTAAGAVGEAAIDTVGAAGGAAIGAVGSVGGAAVDTVGAAGGAALDAAGVVGGAAVGGVKSVGGAIGGIFGVGKDKPAQTNAPAASGSGTDEQTSTGGGVVGGVKAVGGAAVGTVSAVGEAAVKTVGAVGGAALDGASAVGGAAIGGVKAVGGAAAGGVKAMGGAISGLFVGTDKDDASKTNAPAATSAKP